MNNFLLQQKLRQKLSNNKNNGGELLSALVMPTNFSSDRKQTHLPRVLVIDVQPSSNSTTTTSPCSSSRESAVIIPVDLSIESHQVPIIVADQYDVDQPDEALRNSSERFVLWNAFYVREKAQEQAFCSAS